MSAIEEAVKRVVQNVLQNAIEKYVGPNLPQYIETLKETVEKVNGFDEKLNYITSQLQEIRHAQNLSANGGPSMAEMIEFGSPNIIRETEDGANTSQPIHLNQMMQQFKDMENAPGSRSSDYYSGNTIPGTGDAPGT